MHVGKLIDRKHPHHVLRVAKVLRGQGVPARAIIVGSGPLESDLRASLGDRDLMVGFANQSEVPELYAAADVVIVASDYETWGLVVNEALAAGTAVLASDKVPAGRDIQGYQSDGVVRVLQGLSPEAWAAECIDLFKKDRGELAREANTAVAHYDLRSTGPLIAARLLNDFGR